MKRLCIFVALLSIAGACQIKPNGEKMVLDYLQENTNGTEYSIIEISEPDSLYSPFELINSLAIEKSKRYSELTGQLVDAFDKQTMRERKAAALEVASLADAEYHKNHEEFNTIANSVAHPTYVQTPPNRIAYQVKYKVDGQLQEDVFYLERSGDEVGHTASEMESKYLELCEMNGKFYSLMNEAKDMARTMR